MPRKSGAKKSKRPSKSKVKLPKRFAKPLYVPPGTIKILKKYAKSMANIDYAEMEERILKAMTEESGIPEPGEILTVKNNKGMNAKIGAFAILRDIRFSDACGADLFEVEWFRNGDDEGQSDGDYYPESFGYSLPPKKADPVPLKKLCKTTIQVRCPSKECEYAGRIGPLRQKLFLIVGDHEAVYECTYCGELNRFKSDYIRAPVWDKY